MTERRFPMHVLPISVLLELERLPIHEDILDKLVIWEEGMAPVIFVSQTWLSNGHARATININSDPTRYYISVFKTLAFLTAHLRLKVGHRIRSSLHHYTTLMIILIM